MSASTPGRQGDPEAAPSLKRVLEQGGLADARLAVQHQHAAATEHGVQQPVEQAPA
jgi:hypothetical protein